MKTGSSESAAVLRNSSSTGFSTSAASRYQPISEAERDADRDRDREAAQRPDQARLGVVPQRAVLQQVPPGARARR